VARALRWAALGLVMAGSAHAQRETTILAAREGEHILLPAVAAGAAELTTWQQPGLSLLSAGGPLAPSRLLVRGLGGARVRASLWGEDVAGALDGDIDATALPWQLQAVVDAGASSDALAGSVRFGGVPSSSFAIEASSFETIRMRAAWRMSAPGWQAFVAGDVGSSGGRFSFLPTTTINDGVALPEQWRDNNDQRRGWLLAGLDAGWLRLRAAMRGHEGGVPGFALAPSLPWRGNNTQAMVSVQAQQVWQQLRWSARLSLQRQQRASWVIGEPTLSSQQSTQLSSSIQLVAPLADMAVARAQAGASAHRVEIGSSQQNTTTITRLAPFALTTLMLRPLRDLPLLVTATARIDVASDQRAAIGGGGAQVGLSWQGQWSPRVQVSLSGRAPTLDELYAPRGLVLGNASLGPERVHEMEAGVRGQSGDAMVVATVFAAQLQHPIVYVHHNAYDIAPINLGLVHRAGVEVKAAAMTPPAWARVRAEVAATWLATGQQGVVAHQPQSVLQAPFGAIAALPNAPAATAYAAITVVGPHNIQVITSMRAKSSSSSNRFGTLLSPGYALFAAQLRWPLANNLVVTTGIDNVLDVRTARDTNLLPLPGRLWSVGLEVTP
jgi:outer membrane receptor protein involved in Fe transport